MTTIATDASVRYDGSGATWGAVLRAGDGHVLRVHGRLGAIGGSCHAKLLAVLRALQATRRDEMVEIICDNDRVVAWVCGKRPPAALANVVRTIRAMLTVRHGRVRWTKAHVANEDPLHREADRLARTTHDTGRD